MRERDVRPARANGESDGSRGRDAVRQWLNLITALAQIAASAYVQTANTDSFSEPFARGDPPIIPAGYAFSIWGLIFAGCLGYAIRQLQPSQRARPVLRRFGWSSAIAFAATAAWPLVAQDRDRIAIAVLLLVVITVALAHAVSGLTRFGTARGPLMDRLLIVAPLSLFLGWASIATLANVGAALRETGLTQPGSVETTVTLVMLGVAAIGASWGAIASRGNPWFAAAVAWALVAIAVANTSGETRTPDPAVAIAAVAAAIVVLTATWLGRRRARGA